MRTLADEHGLTEAFVLYVSSAEHVELHAAGYMLAVYEWDSCSGIARLTYERTVDGIREREVVQQLHGTCYVPAEVRAKL